MLVTRIVVITVLSAHLCDLAQRRGHPFGIEARFGGRQLCRHLFEMGLVQSSSILLQLHFSVRRDSLYRALCR